MGVPLRLARRSHGGLHDHDRHNAESLRRGSRELGPTFAERASAADQNGAFVSDNYRDLKVKKLFSAGVPKDLGGGGATHAELCEMLREVGHYCPSTALALSMHTHLVAAAVWRHGQWPARWASAFQSGRGRTRSGEYRLDRLVGQQPALPSGWKAATA